jgi:hypothetical protein
MDKSFLVLFCKKERFPCLSASWRATPQAGEVHTNKVADPNLADAVSMPYVPPTLA